LSTWQQSTTLANETTGYFKNAAGNAIPVGGSTTTVFNYVQVGSIIKFTAPTINGITYYFDRNNRLQPGVPTKPDESLEIWASPQAIIGDGYNGGIGNLPSGAGPVTLNNFVPTNAVVDSIIPVFITDLPLSLEQQMGDQIELFRNFGIGYASTEITTPQGNKINPGTWYLISSTNLDANATWSQTNAGSTSGTNQDSSWLAQFVVENQNYTVTFRGLAYNFGSVLQTRFFFYDDQLVYDSRTGTIIKDFINVLAMNTQPNNSNPLQSDVYMNIIGQPVESDGYVDDFHGL